MKRGGYRAGRHRQGGGGWGPSPRLPRHTPPQQPAATRCIREGPPTPVRTPAARFRHAAGSRSRALRCAGEATADEATAGVGRMQPDRARRRRYQHPRRFRAPHLRPRRAPRRLARCRRAGRPPHVCSPALCGKTRCDAVGIPARRSAIPQTAATRPRPGRPAAALLSRQRWGPRILEPERPTEATIGVTEPRLNLSGRPRVPWVSASRPGEVTPGVAGTPGRATAGPRLTYPPVSPRTSAHPA